MTSEWSVEAVETDVGSFHLGPVDLELAPGHAVAVLGTSGAGKTTLLRTLAGFLPVGRGRIVRGSVDISDWLPEERGLGYVPQGLGLLPHRTVEGNVRYPMELRGRSDASSRTKELLEQFGLAALARRHPARLSGGEQQRVALARALAAEPGLIVWDEPWQGLDVLARHDLGVVMADLRERERIPVVIVTHDPTLAFSVADSFLLLEGGRVRDHCDAASLLRAPPDAFAARFVGYENVFDRTDLEVGGAGALRAWLLERSGSEGVAFASPTYPPDPTIAPLWEATIRTARPSPQGLLVEGSVEGFRVSLRVPLAGAAPTPAVGERIRFGIDPSALQPLGTRRSGGTRP